MYFGGLFMYLFEFYERKTIKVSIQAKCMQYFAADLRYLTQNIELTLMHLISV